ncbi:ribosome maturation factor RimP [Mucilaginibacter sp. KACC 22063]|uniref:ribosome maturation factor RimP n=1 Tax=Mucilaginibacter sp. KACC 22063 TaxID=3025666 RepID=UPI002365E547|nr:ribosome assembly cofactor RimP [Mucilaginibacter sp. KACC 22063]WDF55373.1 ribosome assembly cofactor RimP [Mucilaginibacter sp. KACC 22063]
MTNIEKRVTQLAEEKLAEIERPDLFIVSVNMQPNGKLTILLDGDQGAGIDACAQVSRYVGHMLEEENTIDSAYTLEVSSPGIDFPLQQHRQFVKNIGRQVSVKMVDGTKKEGQLTSVDADSITIIEKVKIKGKKAEEVEVQLPFNQLTETKVLISFK